MTLMDKLRELFGDKLDKEIIDEGAGLDGKEQEEGTRVSESKKSKDTPGTDGTESSGTNDTGDNGDTVLVKGGETVKILEDGWYNKETGEIDVTKVKDESVLEALGMLNNTIATTKDSFTVSNAISEAVSGLKLTISNDMFKKLLDTSNIRVDGDKVVGITEAIDAIKALEPGMFKGETSKTDNNPLNKGFDPVNKTNDNPGNWSEAFAMQEAIK